MSDWPTEIGGNMFGLAKLDPEKPMTLRLATWSNVFGGSGAVSIDGFDENGKRSYHSFARIEVEQDGPVTHERAHLQDLIDEFNEDPQENWRRMVTSARERVLAFYAKQSEEYAEKRRRALEGDFS